MIDALEAARLVKADYDNQLDLFDRKREAGLCFSIARHEGRLIGICRGTTDGAGWRANLSFFHKPWPGTGETGDEWHKGWLENAKAGALFFAGRNVAMLLGHSKGGAEAQIIAVSLGIDAMTFGAPAPLWRRVSRALPSIVNHCRADDLVCRLPPAWLGYRRVGETVWHEPAKRHWGEDHRIGNYIEAVSAWSRTA